MTEIFQEKQSTPLVHQDMLIMHTLVQILRAKILFSNSKAIFSELAFYWF